MTDRALLQQALEALQAYGAHTPNCDHLMLLLSLPPQRKPCSCGLVATMQALRERLAQPEQEPVAWADMDVRGEDKGLSWTPGHFHKTPLYTTPPQRKHNNGVIAERQRIVNLLMIQHEAAKGAHNYWHVAAQLIQADVASDT